MAAPVREHGPSTRVAAPLSPAPYFGELPVTSITRSSIQNWVKSLESKGLSPWTVHNACQVLRPILEAAVDEGIISSSPYRNISKASLRGDEMLYLDRDKLHALADAAGKDSTLILTAGYMGLRWASCAPFGVSGSLSSARS